MLKKIVIAADSFKGSVSSAEFAEVCKQVISKNIPSCETVAVKLGDGGEGTLDALCSAYKARKVEVAVAGPLFEEVKACYAISADGQTALIEMAQAAGLTLIDAADRNPMKTTTFGVGQMIADAVARGCSKIIVGLGGSATNDAGLGMLSALGYRFLDRDCNVLCGIGANLGLVDAIDTSDVMPQLKNVEFLVACDVDNPFCGPEGAAHVFAAQKGASPEQIEFLDRGMENLAHIIYKSISASIASLPGAGAAGGLGGAFAAFLNARLCSGINLVLEACNFSETIKGADLIITGEGRIDSQTARGKVLSGVVSAANKAGVPVIALAGSVDVCDDVQSLGLTAVFSIQQRPISLVEALNHEVTCENIAFTLIQILRLCNC